MTRSTNLERVILHWHAVPNTNRSRGGWMPVYDHNSRQRGDTYGRGYALETALTMAEAAAKDEAARYVGDWDVVVAQKPGSAGMIATTPRVKRAESRPPKQFHDLPWQDSYANWTIRVGEAAAHHGSSIAFGAETHDAWEAGVSPDAYAKARGRASQ